MKTLQDILNRACSSIIMVNGTLPNKLTLTSGRLAVVTGTNATGKSMVRRLIGLACKDDNIECMGISMEGRRGYMASLVYGDENSQATGEISSNLITGGLRTSASRAKDGKQHLIFWDEPEIGLSPEYHLSVAQHIAELSIAGAPELIGVIVCTHAIEMLKPLATKNPHHLHMGEKAYTLLDWANRPIIPADIKEIPTQSHKLFAQIQGVINAKNHEREESRKPKVVSF